MHVPDGFINGATSASAAVVAAGSVGVALRRVGQRLMDESLALAGLVAAFVFAAQMVNFPVAAGTSGHLIGGALAAVLVGLPGAVVIMAAVLVVQSLLFADGGLTALGINVLNLAVLAPLTAWLVFRSVFSVVGQRRSLVVPIAACAAWASVVVASIGFTVQYAVGGHGDAPVGAVLAAMVGVHGLIGIGEAFVTAMVVRSVLAKRPDLISAARGVTMEPVTIGARPRVGLRFGLVAIGVAVLVAVGVSQLASGNPDGLERVAIDQGFEATANEHTLAGQALADYGAGFDDEATGTATSGLVGTAVALGLTLMVLWAAIVLARRRSASVDWAVQAEA